MKEFICDGTKYRSWGEKSVTIDLPLALPRLPETITTEGLLLTLKSDFHVSLVCIDKIKEKHRIEIPDFTNKVVADFCKFVREKDIDFAKFRDEFRFVSEGEKRTVIAMCDVTNLDEFFQRMNKKYGLAAEYPPIHVTLYTLQPDRGIFVVDAKDLRERTKIIPNPGIAL